MDEPLCWSSIQIGTFLSAKDGVSHIASVSLIALLQRCLSAPYLAIIGAASNAGADVLMGLARSDLMLYMGTLTATFPRFHSASSSCPPFPILLFLSYFLSYLPSHHILLFLSVPSCPPPGNLCSSRHYDSCSPSLAELTQVSSFVATKVCLSRQNVCGSHRVRPDLGQ